MFKIGGVLAVAVKENKWLALALFDVVELDV